MTEIVRWCLKVDGPLSTRSTRVRIEDGELTIEQIRREDSGKYECVAVNVVTSVVTSTQLIVERQWHSASWVLTIAHVYQGPNLQNFVKRILTKKLSESYE